MEKSIQKLLQFSVINVDKPSGPTSFSCSDYIRKHLREFEINKTSHFGTLDPKVTGVLPIALGRACKLTGFLLGHDKEYVGIMHVHKEISIEDLQKKINEKFIGVITQLPPKKSRVKRQEREREIMEFKLLEKNNQDFLFITKVQGGTYIRKLIHDLGEELDGAHMTELRRTQAGVFKEQDSINMYKVKEAIDEFKKGNEKPLRAILIPGEEVIKLVFPVLQVRESAVQSLLTGKPLRKEDLRDGKQAKALPEKFAIFFKDKFIEIARAVDEAGIIARSEFVYN
jgi:H/ACA ribonucleoprotein complex subunit 4